MYSLKITLQMIPPLSPKTEYGDIDVANMVPNMLASQHVEDNMTAKLKTVVEA